MAIFSASVRAHSRSKGHSAVAGAAYRSGDKLEERETGTMHDYEKKQGVVCAAIVAPRGVDVPEWVFDRAELWNAQHEVGTAKNACLAREVMVALPHELTDDQRVELAEAYAGWVANRHQVMCDYAIHRPGRDGDDRNHHMHLMMSANVITPDGFQKKKSYVNEDGERVRYIPFDAGGKIGGAETVAFREQAAKSINEAYERAGLPLAVDHRSYVDQELDKLPTIHLGKHATGLERRGVETELGRENRQIVATNIVKKIASSNPRVSDEPRQLKLDAVAKIEPEIEHQIEASEAGGFRQFFDSVFERTRSLSNWLKEKTHEVAERFRREDEQQELDLQNAKTQDKEKEQSESYAL